MKALAATMVLATVLAAGCSGIDMDAPMSMSQQAQCEQQRGGGVWVVSAGAAPFAAPACASSEARMELPGETAVV